MKLTKAVAILTGVTLLMASAGCGAKPTAASSPAITSGSSTVSNWKWERKIEIVCPWGAGGPADMTLRAFTAELEKEVGVPIVVNNKSGAGGSTGVEFATKQPADGYTYLLCTPSPMLAQINGSSMLDVYGSIVPVTRLVHDTNIFVTGKNAPFKTFEELQKYIDANPSKVKCGVMAVTGLDGLTLEQIFDGKVEAVAYNEAPELSAAIIGGHIDLAIAGPAECMALVQSGDMVPLMVCAEQRMTTPEYKDVPSSKELGINAFIGPYRGIFAKTGTPEEAIAAFEAAAEKAVKSKGFQDWAASQGLDQRPGYQNRADFKATWDSDYKMLTDLVAEAQK